MRRVASTLGGARQASFERKLCPRLWAWNGLSLETNLRTNGSLGGLLQQQFRACSSNSGGNLVVPEDELDWRAVRSSGPGGQNVNKASSKVEMRFMPRNAKWLPSDVRKRLEAQQRHRMNKRGELVLSSQEERSQALNRRAALRKLQEMVDQASIAPKKRAAWEGISEQSKVHRTEYKRKRSQVKQMRRVNKNDY